MKKERSFLFLLGCIGLLLIFPNTFWGAEAIKIGFVHSLSGPGSVYGKPQLDATEIAVAEINGKGGVLGRKIELIVRDDKTKPEDGLREAKDLVLNKRVDYLVGTTSSAVAGAISGFAREQKKLFFVGQAAATMITSERGHRYVFRMGTNTAIYCRSAARLAAQLPFNKLYMIGPDYEYGHASSQEFLTALRKLKPNVEVVKEAYYPLGTPDFKPYALAIMSSGAEFCYSSIWAGDWITFAKQAKGLGYFEKIKDIGPNHASMEEAAALGTEMPEGLIGGTQYPFWALKSKESEVFVKKFKEKTGKYPGEGAVTGYTTVQFILEAITKARSAETEKVIDALEGMTLETPVGKILLRKLDHQAMWPFWWGTTKFIPEYPTFAILTDLKVFDPQLDYQTENEIKALRAKQ
jgi:branched-chain amino acid transport system substrate-binding protein